MSDQTLHDVASTIMSLEEELHLFDLKVDGTPLWERIRMDVYWRTNRELQGNLGSSHEYESLELMRGLAHSCRDIVTALGPVDVLVWCVSRREQQDDGKWWDIYTDYVNKEILDPSDVSYLAIETPNGTTHHRPARTSELAYIDYVYYAGAIARILADKQPGQPHVDGQLTKLSRELQKRLGVSVDVQKIAARKLAERRGTYPLFRRLLCKTDPRVAFFVSSYGYLTDTFLEACADLNVTTVEFQHGGIYPAHLGYSFPGHKEKELIPDYFLSFGEYWHDATEYPFSEERIVPVGYPHFEAKRAEHSKYSTDTVVFISQPVVGDALSQFACEFAERTDKDVVYKIHPKVSKKWRTEYPRLIRSDINVVTDEPSLYELFSRASHQVGVFSTAVYEGVTFDLETYLVDIYGIETMDRFVAAYDVPVVSSPEELIAAMAESRSTEIPVDDLFKRDAVSNVSTFIKEELGLECADEFSQPPKEEGKS